MKKSILTLKGTETKNLTRDAFIVMGAISLILLGVQVLYWCHLIKAFSWQ